VSLPACLPACHLPYLPLPVTLHCLCLACAAFCCLPPSLSFCLLAGLPLPALPSLAHYLHFYYCCCSYIHAFHTLPPGQFCLKDLSLAGDGGANMPASCPSVFCLPTSCLLSTCYCFPRERGLYWGGLGSWRFLPAPSAYLMLPTLLYAALLPAYCLPSALCLPALPSVPLESRRRTAFGFLLHRSLHASCLPCLRCSLPAVAFGTCLPVPVYLPTCWRTTSCLPRASLTVAWPSAWRGKIRRLDDAAGTPPHFTSGGRSPPTSGLRATPHTGGRLRAATPYCLRAAQ